MSDEEKKFSIKYRIEAKFGQFDSKDGLIAGPDWGVADGIFLGILNRYKGELNAYFTMTDGEGNHNDLLMVQTWILLTEQLAKSKTLPPSMKQLPEKYLEEINAKLGREENAKDGQLVH